MKSSSTDKYVCFKFERKSTFNIVQTKKKTLRYVSKLFVHFEKNPTSFIWLYLREMRLTLFRTRNYKH